MIIPWVWSIPLQIMFSSYEGCIESKKTNPLKWLRGPISLQVTHEEDEAMTHYERENLICFQELVLGTASVPVDYLNQDLWAFTGAVLPQCSVDRTKNSYCLWKENAIKFMKMWDAIPMKR